MTHEPEAVARLIWEYTPDQMTYSASRGLANRIIAEHIAPLRQALAKAEAENAILREHARQKTTDD